MNSLLLVPEMFASEGGIARILRLYLKALCELSNDGDSVRIVSLNDDRIDPDDLLRYTDGGLAQVDGCNGDKLAFCYKAVSAGLRSDRIICGHIAQLPVAWATSLLRYKLPYYLVAHGLEVWRPYTFLERRALAGARRVWCVSGYTRQQVLSNFPLPEERVAILPNALDPFMNPPSPIPMPGGPAIILSISRLSSQDDYKGINHLILAMPAVRSAVPGARLRIVGRGDGLPALRELARSAGLADAVDFAGYRTDSELHEDIAKCRLFALPSQKEGFGLVYLEAMAHGRPCLAARSGGAPEVVNSETGVLVDYGDVPGISAAIVEALSREWPAEILVERTRFFSYLRFKARLASLISQ